jgi:hypothetical protein
MPEMEAPGLTSLGKTCSLDGLANVEVYSLMMSFLGQLAARRLDTLPRGGRRRAQPAREGCLWGRNLSGLANLGQEGSKKEARLPVPGFPLPFSPVVKTSSCQLENWASVAGLG